MKQTGMIVRRLLFYALLLILSAAFGCTTADEQFLDTQGTHPAGWVSATGSSTHTGYAVPDGGAACKGCHGDDLRGGISRVSCYTASWNGFSCHGGGPFHTLSWLDCTYRGTKNPDNTYNWHATAYGNNTPLCTTCHDLNVKCVICHFDIGGRRVPVGSTWSHGSSGHDNSVFADNASVKAVCMNCHDTHNRFGHMPQPFCHNCH